MANSAKVSMTASVFRDDIRNKFYGESIQNLGSNYKWVYKSANAPSDPAAVFTAGEDFMGNLDATNIHGDDKVIWLAIKHVGKTKYNGNTNTNEAIMLHYTGEDPLYNGASGSNNNNIIIANKELFTVRLNGVKVSDLIIGTVVLGNSYNATAKGLDTVGYKVAAIVEDVA